MVYDFYEVFLIFVFWGFAGWLVECIDMRIEAGEFQNRGFLHMPFCPIYGVGMAAGAVALSGLKDSYVGCSILKRNTPSGFNVLRTFRKTSAISRI